MARTARHFLPIALALLTYSATFIYVVQPRATILDSFGGAPGPEMFENTGIRKNETHTAIMATHSGSGQAHHAIQPLPLDQLVQSALAADTSCPEGSWPILDTLNSNRGSPARAEDNDGKRKIPHIVHLTSKSRCATPPVHALVDEWRLANHSLYFHDDDAVARLARHPLSRAVAPLLNETLRCVTNGATRSDLWRYLVLHTYGGIYADVDVRPVAFTGATIRPTDDAFFVLESLGVVAQYFLAISPAHPLMGLALDNGIANLRQSVNVMRNNPALTTGPKALKHAFILFVNGTSNGYVEKGTYVGIGGTNERRSARVMGDKRRPKEHVDRGGLSQRDKAAYYKVLQLEHFHENKRFPRNGRISCMEHLRRTNGTHRVAKYRVDGAQYVVDE